jgi:hypothetical protein
MNKWYKILIIVIPLLTMGVGLTYGYKNIKTKEFILNAPRCYIEDHTKYGNVVLTLYSPAALKNNKTPDLTKGMKMEFIWDSKHSNTKRLYTYKDDIFINDYKNEGYVYLEGVKPFKNKQLIVAGYIPEISQKESYSRVFFMIFYSISEIID